MKKRFTKGQMKMGLAAELYKAGVDAALAFTIAADSVDALGVPDKWRDKLGPQISEAIDADLRDPKTWAA